MSDLEGPLEELSTSSDPEYDNTQLWVISYSDFMTILMIFFLMLFAHRLWAKTVVWEAQKEAHLRAAQESQKGMVQRLQRLAQVDVQAERIDIHLPDALLFEVGHSELHPNAARLLATLAPELKKFEGEIIVEGHTDDQAVGAKATYRSNWELSVARAFSVIYCLTQDGVPPSRLSARGYGAYRPRVPNDSAAHRAENRRIEIVLLNPKKTTGVP